jgi:hypothetical protein
MLFIWGSFIRPRHRIPLIGWISEASFSGSFEDPASRIHPVTGFDIDSAPFDRLVTHTVERQKQTMTVKLLKKIKRQLVATLFRLLNEPLGC